MRLGKQFSTTKVIQLSDKQINALTVSRCMHTKLRMLLAGCSGEASATAPTTRFDSGVEEDH